MIYNEFKKLVMAHAAACRLTEYELYATSEDGFGVEALKDEINSVSSAAACGACFRCIHNGRMGYSSTELYTEEEAHRIVEEAMANAGQTEDGEGVTIFPGSSAYASIPETTTTIPTVRELSDFVLSMQKTAYESDARVADGTQSFASYSTRTISLTNSYGLDLTCTQSYSVGGCFTITHEEEEMYDGSKVEAKDFAALNAAWLGQEAVRDALSSIGAGTVETGSYSVAFSGKMTAALLATFLTAFSGEAAEKGISLLAGKEGTQVAAPCVTIVDDPLLDTALVRTPFDSEGVATFRKELIANGTLQTFLHNLASAKKAGIPSTGNGVKGGYASPVGILPYNFYLAGGGAGSLADILKALDTGIYITELNGMHAGANPVTGDFSLSAAGFLIEHGEKTKPVKNFTVSGNFYTLLASLALVGDDVEFQIPRGQTCFGGPTIAVKSMSIAGK